MSDGFTTAGWTCQDGLDQAVHGWHCDTAASPAVGTVVEPACTGVSLPTSDPHYALFLNGVLLPKDVLWSPGPGTNEVTIFFEPGPSDVLSCRRL